MDCWESYYHSGGVNSGAGHYHYGVPGPSMYSFGHTEASGDSASVYTELSSNSAEVSGGERDKEPAVSKFDY